MLGRVHAVCIATAYIVYMGGGCSLKVRAFLDFAAPRLKGRLAADLA